jgi:hypothetical protein
MHSLSVHEYGNDTTYQPDQGQTALVPIFVMLHLAHFQLEDRPQNEREILGTLLVANSLFLVGTRRYGKLGGGTNYYR